MTFFKFKKKKFFKENLDGLSFSAYQKKDPHMCSIGFKSGDLGVNVIQETS